jgi:hypothetical protein
MGGVERQENGLVIGTRKRLKTEGGSIKKLLGWLLALGFLAGGVWAQDRGRKVEFTLSFGFLTNLSGTGRGAFTGSLMTLGVSMDFHAGELVMISPEVMVAANSFYFNVATVYPGVILNFKIGRFFIGGGVVLPSSLNCGRSDTSDLSPKLNIGLRFFGATLAAYLIGDFHGVSKRNLFGMSMGFRF